MDLTTVWWNLTKRISGFCRPHARFAPDVDSLATYFARKLSLPKDFDCASPTLLPEVSTVIFKKSWRIKLSKVRQVLNSLDIKKSVGPDGVSPYILKYCCNELCVPLNVLFSRVCRSGEFP